MKPYRTEWKIVDPEARIGGNTCFVGKFDDGTFGLIDWRNNKDLAEKLSNKFGKRAR